MTAAFELLQPPFSDEFISECHSAANDVFTKVDRGSLVWRLTRMPDVTVVTARIDGQLVGFKAGYAASDRRYYSWLGGVVPSVRQQGVALGLMQVQHQWLAGQPYLLVDTHVRHNNHAMIALNEKAGLGPIGHFDKAGERYLIMQKAIPTVGSPGSGD